MQTSRRIVFDHICEKIGEEYLNKSFPEFANKSIRDLLVHSASCYFHWLAYLALRQPNGSIYEGGATVEELRRLYVQVDETMELFLRHFSGSMNEPFAGVHDDGWRVMVTPLELFIHVTTHEYHHKGQLVLMCRLLGHVPPDTDASNAFQEGEPGT